MIDKDTNQPEETAFTNYAELMANDAESGEIRHMNYLELPEPAALKVGDVIDGLNTRSAFKSFEVIAVEHIQDIDDGTGFVPEGLWVPNKSLDVVMAPPKYTGEISGGVAVVDAVAADAYQFKVVAELSSTGRGVQGYTMRQVRYELGKPRKSYPVVRKLSKDDGLLGSDALSKALLEESRFMDAEARREAISKTILAGLPSLGKNRS